MRSTLCVPLYRYKRTFDQRRDWLFLSACSKGPLKVGEWVLVPAFKSFDHGTALQFGYETYCMHVFLRLVAGEDLSIQRKQDRLDDFSVEHFGFAIVEMPHSTGSKATLCASMFSRGNLFCQRTAAITTVHPWCSYSIEQVLQNLQVVGKAWKMKCIVWTYSSKCLPVWSIPSPFFWTSWLLECYNNPWSRSTCLAQKDRGISVQGFKFSSIADGKNPWRKEIFGFKIHQV
jgi:hypothetical protein